MVITSDRNIVVSMYEVDQQLKVLREFTGKVCMHANECECECKCVCLCVRDRMMRDNSRVIDDFLTANKYRFLSKLTRI